MHRRDLMPLFAVALLAAGCGQSKPDCKVGLVDCGGSCIDPLTDPNHCGAATGCTGGQSCGTGFACSGGTCSGLLLLRICFPPAPDPTSACIYPATCDALLATPMVDVGAAYNFLLPIQFDNQTTSGARIEKYMVTYSVPGTTVPGSVVLANVTVPAGGSTVALVEVVPNATVTQLSAIATATPTTTFATVVAAGHYLDGNSFQTGPYRLAVGVCSGCMGTPVANQCSGTTVFKGACPGSAVVGGKVVSLPVNILCQ